MPKTLTKTEIAARIVPQRARWSKDGLVSWNDLHHAVDLLHHIANEFENAVVQIEQDPDLSREGIARKRSELARRTLQELADFAPLRKAEKSVRENIDLLTTRMTTMPAPPHDVADVMLAAEIRTHIRAQPSPASTVMTHIGDSRVVAAAIFAPGILTGLNEREVATIREHSKRALHPHEAALQDDLSKALTDLRTGVESAGRMVKDRANL